MSRFKKFAHSLASGYVLLGANVVYTLASVRLALHYLPNSEFGLWALVTQVSSYFLLFVDLGMAGSVARILIDHKDRPTDGVYGGVIKVGALVMLVQGSLIAGMGILLSWWFPSLFDVPEVYRSTFRFLIAGHCGILGVLYAGRMCGHVLQAHQRYDMTNYASISGLAVSFGVLWLGFSLGWGLYSMLAAAATSMISSNLLLWAATLRLHLFPPAGAWGKAQWSLFKELFKFGSDLFLMSMGYQLVSASQVMIISRTLGLETAAVWAIATKLFIVMQQAVFQLWTYSANAISEMFVRQERQRLEQRFREIVVLTAAVSVLVAGVMATCNSSFLDVWLKGRITWNEANNWLISFLLIVSCVSRCHVGLVGQTKKIRAMRYIYFAEGLCFVIAGLLVAPRWGMSGMLVAAISMNLIWSGAYGVRRTAEEFEESVWHVAFSWLKGPLVYLVLFLPLAALVAWLLQSLPNLPRLLATAVLVGAGGLVLLWFVGLTPELRQETAKVAAKVRSRLRPLPAA